MGSNPISHPKFARTRGSLLPGIRVLVSTSPEAMLQHILERAKNTEGDPLTLEGVHARMQAYEWALSVVRSVQVIGETKWLNVVNEHSDESVEDTIKGMVMTTVLPHLQLD